MNDNLSGQQFAQFSARTVPHPIHDYEYEPLPASMERHAPGEYQPTLPGMEHMLEGEQTHTSVFFPKPKTLLDGGMPVGSNWDPRHREGVQEKVDPKTLHPAQDWVENKHLEDPYPRLHGTREREWGGRPLVERIHDEPVLQDGHHRTARAILRGAKQVDVMRWNA